MSRYVGADSSTYPYAAVAYIEATFSDGSRVSGSGALVGRNDVLTAAHVIYDSVLGAAESVSVELGRDGASQPYGTFSAASLNYYEVANESPGFFTQSESELDLGLVSLSDAVGDDIGWFALGDVINGQSYRVTGYPGVFREASGPRLIEDTGVASSMRDFDLVSLENVDINPGNSGGPIWYSSLDGPVVVGAISTSLWGAEVSAHYDILSSWMSANDYLIPPLSPWEVSTPFGIQTSRSPVDRFALLLDSEGWTLPDTLYESLQNSETLLRYPVLEDTIDPIIRLYTGMLGREPELEGVEYWVSQFNAGNGLKESAAGFASSDEFVQLSNNLGGGNDGAIEALYNTVLGRNADESGQVYWQSVLAAENTDLSDVVLAFTNSDEYAASSFSLVQGAKLLLWGVDLQALNPIALGFGDALNATELENAGALVRLYSGVLDRVPDDDGLDYWLEVLAGGETLLSVADAFLSGSEFLDSRAGGSEDAFITTLYSQVLSREPDAEGMSFWLEQLQLENFGKQDLVLAFTESDEYLASSDLEVQSVLSQYQQVDMAGVLVDTQTYLLG